MCLLSANITLYYCLCIISMPMPYGSSNIRTLNSVPYLVSVCVSVQGCSGTTGYRASYEQYQRLQNNVTLKIKGDFSKTTAFRQLNGRTYLLYTKTINSQISLKPFLSKVRRLFTRLWLLAFTVHR